MSELAEGKGHGLGMKRFIRAVSVLCALAASQGALGQQAEGDAIVKREKLAPPEPPVKGPLRQERLSMSWARKDLTGKGGRTGDAFAM